MVSNRRPMTPERLRAYRVRTCNSMHECCLCESTITLGQRYHDGGYGKRAHVECCAAGVSAKDWKQASDALRGAKDKP